MVMLIGGAHLPQESVPLCHSKAIDNLHLVEPLLQQRVLLSHVGVIVAQHLQFLVIYPTIGTIIVQYTQEALTLLQIVHHSLVTRHA